MKAGDMVLIATVMREGRDDKENDNFVIGILKTAPVLWGKENSEMEVRMEKVLWSDFKGWKTRLRENRVPFALELPWVCEKKKIWRVDTVEQAQAIVMGARL